MCITACCSFCIALGDAAIPFGGFGVDQVCWVGMGGSLFLRKGLGVFQVEDDDDDEEDEEEEEQQKVDGGAGDERDMMEVATAQDMDNGQCACLLI